jgi:phage recombination protein Bet
MRDIMALGWTKGQVEAIANTVAKGATLHELYTFLYINKSYGLDPFKRESHFMKDHKTGRWSIIIGIDGMRKIARRDPSYLGVQAFAVREGDEFAVDAANYTVVHKFGKQRGKVLGAWARADAKGRMPVIVWVDFEEYYRPGWDAWVRMPATMIAKVAESHALRRQFGLGDLYTEEEMGVQVSEVPDADEVTVAVPTQEAPDVPVFTDEPEPVTETEAPVVNLSQPQPAAAEPLAQSAPQKKAEYEEKASLSALTMLRDVFKRKCPGQDIAEFLKERAGVQDPRDLTKAQCKRLIDELQKLPDAKKANEAPKQERPVPAAGQKQAAQQAAALQPGSEALFKMLTAGEVREFPDGRKYYVVQASAVQPAVPGTFELYCPVDKVSMLDKAQPNMHIAVAISKVNGSRLLASTAVITEAA